MSDTPDHYNMEIQPIEFIVKNNIPFREANIIKYVCRHRDKDGIDDLLKAQHYLQMLIDEWEAENEVIYETPTLAEQLAEQEKKKAEIIAKNTEWEAIVKACNHKRRESIKTDDEIEQLENLKAHGFDKRKGKIEQAKFTGTVIIGRK
jgi:tRNA G26 N,N-dimethylase Trm1